MQKTAACEAYRAFMEKTALTLGNVENVGRTALKATGNKFPSFGELIEYLTTRKAPRAAELMRGLQRTQNELKARSYLSASDIAKKMQQARTNPRGSEILRLKGNKSEGSLLVPNIWRSMA